MYSFTEQGAPRALDGVKTVDKLYTVVRGTFSVFESHALSVKLMTLRYL